MFSDPRPLDPLDLSGAATAWRKMEFLFSTASNVKVARDGTCLTRRRTDESRPGGHRLYPIVERHLDAAEDAYRALRSVLTVHGATQVAMWSLLRTQFENSARALWHVRPESSRERVLRAIATERGESHRNHQFDVRQLKDAHLPLSADDRARTLRSLEVTMRDHDSTYRAEVERLGGEWGRLPRMNVTEDLGGLEPENPGFGALLRHAWSLLSGLQHGSTTSLLRVSDQVELQAVVPGGMVRLELSPSQGSVDLLVQTTTFLTVSALARYVDCHTGGGGPVDLRLIAAWRRAINHGAAPARVGRLG